MKTGKPPAADKIAEALGAERVVSLDRLPSQGPLDLLELRAEVESRLRSTGGRPTDPRWDVRRLIPFRREGWDRLEHLATLLAQEGQRVSPGQLAALLIERSLKSLEETVDTERTTTSRS